MIGVHRNGIGSHQSARMINDEWLTPPEIISSLGPFDLDPCSPITPPWPTATKHFTINHDGLSMPWSGFVWLNPPYGKETIKWLAKMERHNNGIALLFARTETEAWFSHIWNSATAILFIHGRLYFYDSFGRKAKANSGAPSALVAYGMEASKRLTSSNISGKLIPLKAALTNNQQ